MSSHKEFSSFPSRRCPVVCGLLGTTNIKNGEDLWMATDFVVLRELIGPSEDRSFWLCGTPIRQESERFLLGDPSCDRIMFEAPPFETVFTKSPDILRRMFVLEIRTRAQILSKGDVLVLVLVGHGTEGGKFIIGDDEKYCELSKYDLEDAVQGTMGTVWLINTACDAGVWESPHWWLLTAAGADEEDPSLADEEDPSLAVSGSEKTRGGFFVTALLAEQASESQLKAPCTGKVGDDGLREPQYPHDFDSAKVRPSHSLPRQRLDEVREWIHVWRDRIGQVYTTASLCFSPCPVSKPHSMPLRPLDSQMAGLHRFQCVPPSDPGVTTSSSSATKRYDVFPVQPAMATPSNPENEAPLIRLAQEYLKYAVQTAAETETIVKCHRLLRGRDAHRPLSESEKGRLFAALKHRIESKALAVAIANNLGWGKVVEEMGGKLAQSMHDQRREAEASGCIVSLLVKQGPMRPFVAAACWLARVWAAVGRPIIPTSDWDRAVEQGFHELRQGVFAS